MLVRERSAGSGKAPGPDILVLDLLMPGMDGLASRAT